MYTDGTMIQLNIMDKYTRKYFFKAVLVTLVPFIAGVIAIILNKYKAFAQSNKINPLIKKNEFEPSYVRLHKNGQLKKRADALWSMMSSCKLCPRECRVNRLKGQTGFCGASSKLYVSSFTPHFGEERPLVGRFGSGTIFMTHCGLRCVFCINWEIAHNGEGNLISIERLAEMMLSLQKQGCHNINIVTPTHYSAHVLKALDIAASRGLRIPLVYNTHGWERREVLQLLDGVVDIYLPDFKYSDPDMAAKYSSDAHSYPEITKQALLEMHKQVGIATPAKDGLMYRGLMIRHLVLPNNVSGTRHVLQWIANNLPKNTYVNIMSQYMPAYRAREFPAIARRITEKEYENAIRWAKEAGLTNLDIQEMSFF